MGRTPRLPYQHAWQGPYQAERDVDHLRVLSICHYVAGGVTMLLSSCGLFYVFMGLAFMKNPNGFGVAATQPAAQPPAELGYIFMGMGSAVVAVGWLIGGLTIYSGRCIATRRARLFSLILAGVNCLSVPIGTLLGVFTFIVLLRDSVARAYAERAATAALGTSRR